MRLLYAVSQKWVRPLIALHCVKRRMKTCCLVTDQQPGNKVTSEIALKTTDLHYPAHVWNWWAKTNSSDAECLEDFLKKRPKCKKGKLTAKQHCCISMMVHPPWAVKGLNHFFILGLKERKENSLWSVFDLHDSIYIWTYMIVYIYMDRNEDPSSLLSPKKKAKTIMCVYRNS